MAGWHPEPRPQYRLVDHHRAAQKWVLTIRNAKKEKVRVRAYRELLSLADKVRGQALEAIDCLQKFEGTDLDQTIAAQMLVDELANAWSRFHQVMDQTARRVLPGEQVPAAEQVVLLFTCHADVTVKGGRDTQYGPKVFLGGGNSGLILDGRSEPGNPADTTIQASWLDWQVELLRRPLRQVAADGGFARQANLETAQRLGVQDVMFAKKRGLRVLEMVKSLWVYKKRQNFRAGMEATISRLKRTFGSDLCTWWGWPGLRQYVWTALISNNVLLLGRLLAQSS